jgi:hypothetical protein
LLFDKSKINQPKRQNTGIDTISLTSPKPEQKAESLSFLA